MERQATGILIAGIVLVIVLIIWLVWMLVSQKRRNNFLLAQKAAEQAYDRAVSVAQLEAKEATLRNISWELHDNIGQLLTLAKIQIGTARKDTSHICEATHTISRSLSELRSLSKLINPERTKKRNLVQAVTVEVERFNRLQFLDASVTSGCTTKRLKTGVEIILFRVLQEFFNQTLQYAQATQLTVDIQYEKDYLRIKAHNNGIGFDVNNPALRRKLALTTMQQKARLIGADIELTSNEVNGTVLHITYAYADQKNKVPVLV